MSSVWKTRLVPAVLLVGLLQACDGSSDSPSGASGPGWVTIETPTSAGVYSHDSTSIGLAGAAFISPNWAHCCPFDPAVTVSWINSATGQSGAASTWTDGFSFFTTHHWSASVGLLVGNNWITITAVDPDGYKGERSILVIVTIPDPPAVPQSLIANPEDARVTLTWQPSARAASYTVYRALAPGVTKAGYASLPGGTKLTGAFSPFHDVGLKNWTTYYYVVVAENWGGESAESMEMPVMPYEASLPAPTGVVGTAGVGSATVTWDPITGASYYIVYRALTPGVNRSNYNSYPGGKKTWWASNPHVESGLTAGVTYYYVVTGVNGAGNEGAESVEVAVTPN